MIAPPHYRIETVTLKKNEGLALLDQALKEVEAGIKERNGTFKLVNKPQIIGDSAKDKDLEEIMKMPGEYESGDGGSSAEEDNEEGMGDVDLEDEFADPTADIDQDEDGEERKTSKVKEGKKKRKASSDEDD